MKLSKIDFVSIINAVLIKDAKEDKVNDAFSDVFDGVSDIALIPYEYDSAFSKMLAMLIGEQQKEIAMEWLYPMGGESERFGTSEDLYNIIVAWEADNSLDYLYALSALQYTTFTKGSKKTTTSAPVQLTIDNLVDALHDGECRVVFKKMDDSVRVMRCTLDESFMDDDKIPSGDKVRIYTPNVIRVYDTEKNDWRSFRKDRFVEAQAI